MDNSTYAKDLTIQKESGIVHVYLQSRSKEYTLKDLHTLCKTQKKRTQTEALSVCQKSHISRLELCVSCHNESQCPCSCFVLSLSLFFLICALCFSDMEGFVNRERSQVVSQGEAALIFPPQIHSFPRPGITWFRDGRKIPPSSRM